MKRALIGHTGFIGGTLLADGGFTHGFDSGDLQDMRGARFDEVVCAGIPPGYPPTAPCWTCSRPCSDRFIFLSTTDVYPDPAQPLDETAVPEGLANHPCGAVEQFVASRFPNHAVARLPAIVRRGAAKNALFDLLHDHNVGTINPAARFQRYPIRRLPGDLARIARAGLRLANLVTEPVALGDVIRRFFPAAAVGPESEPAPRYDLRTRHAELFGGTSPYIMARSLVLLAMGDFIKAARRRPQRRTPHDRPARPVTALARDLVRIDSRSFVSNLAIAEAVEAALAGFAIERIDYTDPAGVPKRALVARRGTGTGGLALAGHMDTVPDTGWPDDPWSARLEGACCTGWAAPT